MTHPTPTAPTRAETDAAIDDAEYGLEQAKSMQLSMPRLSFKSLETFIQAAKSGGARFTREDLVKIIHDAVPSNGVFTYAESRAIISRLESIGAMEVRP